MTKRRLVLITGAGASVELGSSGQLPLMGDWADAIIEALDDEEAGLALALHLELGMSGEDFERRLGELFAFFRSLPLVDKFLQAGRIDQTGVRSDVFDWLGRAQSREPRIIRAINASLWQEFGLPRIDTGKAVEAYRRLCEALRALPSHPETQLFSATTNYDRGGEEAWVGLGFSCDDGTRTRNYGGSAYLSVEAIEPWKYPGTVPHLHLHGAVGWYRDENGIRVDPADREYDEREIPAVLYPDPAKDPANETDVGVHAIWTKFREALDATDHILVLGHSLHDPPLVEAVAQRAAQRNVRVAITFYGDGAEDAKLIIHQLAGTRLSQPDVDLSLIPLSFGADANCDLVARWIDGATIEANGRVNGP